ncbi:hypothetical protein GWL_31830 [Herbaspirillum sp. GW103]|nr:hypothetical protein GWL_31830 [Herbaspirillum sp. GW103]
MKAATDDNRVLAMVYRIHDMTPSSSRNLDVLQEHFRRAGSVFLIPVAFNPVSPDIEMTSKNFDLGIKLSHLQFIPAWKVSENSPLVSAMSGITDPVLPSGVTDAPFLQALERLKRN